MTGEFEARPYSGWRALPVLVLAAVSEIVVFVLAINRLEAAGAEKSFWPWGAVTVAVVLLAIATGVCFRGLFAVAPNAAVVLVLFGEYRGTVRATGFHWTNPFNQRIRLSLRVRNMTTDKLKVNDVRGNPVEIAAVVVWRITDTFRAVFDVDDYKAFVSVQSESALRHLASAYPYDSHTESEKSLRGSMDEVNHALQSELQERLSKAGVVVDEARLMHLAYAPEVAGAMLRRQQAEAVVAARTRIVEGAVGMVESALEHLARSRSVTLDDERKAAMVSNLMVVLCGDQGVQPVVNTGTLYT